MTKKKSVIILFAFLSIIVLSIFLLGQTIQKTKQRKEKYLTIPSFELSDLHGNNVTDSILKKNKSTLFMFFDPACESCKSELEQIKSNQNLFKNHQIVFSSTLPADTVIHFLDEMAFQPSPNMYFIVDGRADLLIKMEINSSPSFLIYNKNGQLIKRFDGPVKVETLIKYLSKK